MARTPSGKKTRQLGWRLDARIVDSFERFCASERKDKVLELEHLMSTALQAAGYNPSYISQAAEGAHLVHDANPDEEGPSRPAPRKRTPR